MSATEYWNQDKLGRKDDADFLTNFLLKRVSERGEMGKSRSYVLNIDAHWGDGKTFFLKGLEAGLTSDGYPVAYVNAWADDHAEDPLVAVVASIDTALSQHLKNNNKIKKDWKKVKESASKLVRAVGAGQKVLVAFTNVWSSLILMSLAARKWRVLPCCKCL